MPSTNPRDRTIAALRACWSSLDDLLTELPDDAWSTPSPLPGWDVRANVAHVIGTEAWLLGEQPPEPDGVAPDHVRNPIGELNEQWVAGLRDETPADLLARLRDVTGRRLADLDAMSDQEWHAVGFTPAGEDAYGRFMQIRVFDCWMHEQDIRAAVGRPGHDDGVAVETTLDEIANALGYVVGKRAGATPGSSVTFELTGPAGRTIHVLVADRATVVPSLDGPATTTIRLPVVAFTRLAGGRADARPEDATVEGDAELAARVLDRLGYTI
jgi:uncharacterized protein (TIGR03083 family)